MRRGALALRFWTQMSQPLIYASSIAHKPHGTSRAAVLTHAGRTRARTCRYVGSDVYRSEVRLKQVLQDLNRAQAAADRQRAEVSRGLPVCMPSLVGGGGTARLPPRAA
jgi:hypothetical protein